MWVGRLVSMIEEHADPLVERFVTTVRHDPRTPHYRDLETADVAARALDVYSHLGQWLAKTSDEAVETEYFALGRHRREEGVPLSEVVMALLLTRRNLWSFVDERGVDSTLELRRQYDLDILVVRFFDRAIYHVVRGYESLD